MKKLIIASVFTAVPFGASAADLSGGDFNFIQDSVPPPSVVGHLELSFGWAQVEEVGDPGPGDGGRFEGRGRVNVPFAGNWNLEIETGGSALFDDGSSRSNIGAFGHLWGGWSGVRVGGFGGVDFVTSRELGVVGVEGEVDIGNVTIGAQGSYNTFIDSSTNIDIWSARVWADLYIAANTRLGIEAQYSNVSNVAPDGDTIWGVEGIAEHRFSGSPISAFVRGGYEDALDRVDTITVSGGVRVFMDGGMDLEEHDRQVPFNIRLPKVLEGAGS